MARSSFVSFHYQRDYWRVQQVLRMGALEKEPDLPSQKWEEVKGEGDKAVEAWIDEQMKYKQAVVVLIGNQTANRKFVKYEILRALTIKKPVLGIRIHGLLDSSKKPDRAGPNPFASFSDGPGTANYDTLVPVYDPKNYAGKASPDSKDIHAAIKNNIATWVATGYKNS